MRIRSAKTALIVVDMQNGFCDEAGSVTAIGLRPLGCARLPVAYRWLAQPRGKGADHLHPLCVSYNYLDGGLMAHELLPDLRDGKTLIAGTDSDLLPEMAPTLRILLLTESTQRFLEPTSTPP